METKIFPANSNGATQAAEVFNLTDRLNVDEIRDKLLHLIKTKTTTSPAWLSAGSIRIINDRISRINVHISELQGILDSHGEGWTELEAYVQRGASWREDDAVAAAVRWLDQIGAPAHERNAVVKRARQSVDIDHANHVADALRDLRHDGVSLGDINHNGDHWALSDAKIKALYEAEINRLTDRETEDLRLLLVIESLINEAERRGYNYIDITNGNPGGLVAETIRYSYDPMFDERLPKADRDRLREEFCGRMRMR